MSTTETKSEYSFQAEIKQLLHLLAHSLYQNKEIAVRELVSNASDALGKMRYVALTEQDHRETGPLEIRIERDEEDGVLTIADNGIGMTHDELVENLGSIAHSGSLDFVGKLTGDAQKDVSLIGQFGVGFYSAFMLAEKVRVVTRSYKDERGWEWESDGAGTFSIRASDEAPERGTRIVLKLRDDMKDFAQEYRIQQILKKYSTFVPHPIKLDDKLVNDVKPIWVEPKSQITEEQYVGFYQHLTHHGEEKPLWHLHFAADSPIQFQAILYCPPTNIEKFGFGRAEHGLHLCAKRILVDSNCEKMLPEYLRFLHGLVDSADLPLNVSRETLQDNTVFRKIRATLVRKVLDRMEQAAKDQPEEYRTFYDEFGIMLKEGVCSDFEHRDRIAKLLRFHSSAEDDPEKLVSLEDYVSRVKPDQEQIYVLGGANMAAIRSNPNLEIFMTKQLEVLLLPEPIDEFVASSLGRFDDKPIVSIDSADLKLPGEDDVAPVTTPDFDRVAEVFKSALSEKVQDVRASKRLADSPCCLVTPEGEASVHMEKFLKVANKSFEPTKRILELNPKSELVERLAGLSQNPDNDDFLRQCALQLYDNALLQEGVVNEPKETVGRIQSLMLEAASNRSPIIH